MTIDEARQILQDLSARFHDDFSATVSATNFNSTCLGQASKQNWHYYIELRAAFLIYGKYDEIINVIKHEWVHYYLMKTDPWNCGHSPAFRAICEKIGCSADHAHLKITWTPQLRAHFYKYAVCCPDHPEVTKAVQYLTRYRGARKCPHCGKDLLVIKNF